jgi:hypothetical protein
MNTTCSTPLSRHAASRFRVPTTFVITASHGCGGDGRFDPDRWLARLEQSLSQGPSVTRFVAHMEWALEGRPGTKDIVEYEARANYLLPKYKDPVICCYDLTRFSGDVVMDIMRTHPLVIVGGILQENPFFVPPDEMIAELRSRTRQA